MSKTGTTVRPPGGIKMTYADKLRWWLDDPNTPADAWMRLPFAEIGRQAGVSEHNACRQIPRILSGRMGKSEKDLRSIRMKFRRDEGLV